MENLAKKKMTAHEYFSFVESSLERYESYRSIQSLQTYILVSTNYKHIEVFKRVENNEWILSEPDSNGNLVIPNPGCTLSLKDVYQSISLEEI